MSQRVLAFEDWLNRLPGKVEATHWIHADNGNPHDDTAMYFGLHFARSGKRWTLSYAYQAFCDDSTPPWQQLSDADVETKIRAVKGFPHLLESLTHAQEKCIKKLAETHEAFDAFAKSIGMKAEGK
jgi:hypothetical protein